MSQIKVFIADDVNDAKLEPLREAGFNVVKETKLSPDELVERLQDAQGVIVRSATKITADIMDKVDNLKVIGRAGVGVDNIDIKAATERGIVVMNAPDGNTITTAEHTFAILVSLARNVPQAHAKLQSGTWDKKSYVGVELHGKTLGIIGLGRIGQHVAKIAKGYEMNVFAFDPFVSDEQAKKLGIEMGSLDDVFAKADFLTIHTPVTDETRGIIGKDAFTKMKDGVRIVNCARGGLVDEDALLIAIEEGKVAGAALDVYSNEPLESSSALLNNPKIITTPHLGASTIEAQQGVALTVAEQIRDFLTTGELRNAVNAPSLAASDLKVLQPHIDFALQIGRFQNQVMKSEAISEVSIEYAGGLVEKDSSPVTRAFLSGLLENISDRVNVVNALHIADERGIQVSTNENADGNENYEINTKVSSSRGSEQLVCGRVYQDGKARITKVGNFEIEAKPHGNMLFCKHKDVPGVIGKIGTCLGEKGVNISSFYLGSSDKDAEALAIIEIDAALESDVLTDVENLEDIITVQQVKL